MKYVRRAVVALLALVVVLYAGAVGFLWANESRFVFRTSSTRSWTAFDPPYRPFTLASAGNLALDAVTLEHPSSRLAAGPSTQFSADAAVADPYWIVYFNGAAGSIHRRRYRDHLEQLHALGYNVLSFDYRGFGRNPGTPTEEGVYADAVAAYRHLTVERRIHPSRIVLAGRSLGSAVAVELATRVRTAGLLLLSPIDSVPRVGARLYPWAPVGLLASNRFDSLSKIGRLDMPVVIVHSRSDRFVPLAVGRSLYEAATGPKLMLETGGAHSSAGFSPVDELGRALERFWPAAVAAGFGD